MSTSPLIGLTSYGKKEANKYNLPAEYVESVRRAGGIPVLLPPGETHLKSLCSRLDGIILCGGGDIHPDRFNGKAHPLIYNVDEQRDGTEFELIRVILEKDIPTLAICRGMQVLNIFLGGSLYEHLPETFGETIQHRLPPRETIKHLVDIRPESKLHGIVSTSQMEIVSWHHQAVKDIPDELTITARSKDGVIEGLELDSHRWLVAVQWHPELSAFEDKLQQKLFDALIEVSS